MTDVEDRVERALLALAKGVQPDLATGGAAARRGSGFDRHQPAGGRVRGSGRHSRRPPSPLPGSVRCGGRTVRHPPGPRRRRRRPRRGIDGTRDLPPLIDGTAVRPVRRRRADDHDRRRRTPEVPTPERLAVLEPQPGVAPIRSDPVLDWAHGATTSRPEKVVPPSLRRRNADRRRHRQPRRGAEWATTFRRRPIGWDRRRRRPHRPRRHGAPKWDGRRRTASASSPVAGTSSTRRSGHRRPTRGVPPSSSPMSPCPRVSRRSPSPSSREPFATRTRR